MIIWYQSCFGWSATKGQGEVSRVFYLNKKINLKRDSNQTGLIFGLIALLICVQIASLLIVVQIIPLHSLITHNHVIVIAGTTTFVLALVLIWAQVLLTLERARVQAVAEHMNDGLLF